MQTVLITGGAGYIGSLLTGELLRRGHRVTCLDELYFGGDAILPYLADDRYCLHKVNVCDRERIAPYFGGVDLVVHLAAIVTDAACQQVGREVAWKYNVEATQHVFELAEASGAKRLIFPSTYGHGSRPSIPPQSLYDDTKIAAERWLLERGRESRCALVLLRLASLFGIAPRARFDLIINRLVLHAATKRRVTIGEDDHAHPFVHVRDAVRAILLALEAADFLVRNRVITVGGAGTHTKREIIEMIRPYIPDIDVEYTHPPLDLDKREPQTFFEQRARLLGYRASTSIPEGIREVYEAIASGLIGDPFSSKCGDIPVGLVSPPRAPVTQPGTGAPWVSGAQIEIIPAAPLVSIITPSYNQGRFIEETILSVLSQDYPHIEYLVIDGGSTDNTLEILKEYEDRITWLSEPDRGQSHAINKGFRMAKGEVLAWLNSDDTYLPGAVRKAVTYLMKHPEVAMVYGEGYRIDENGLVKARFPWTEPFDLWKLVYVSDYILQQTAFFRRRVFDAIDMLDETLHWGMDWDLWIRIGKHFRIDYLPEYFANLREYEGAKTSSGGPERFRELVTVMRRHGARRYPPAYVNYGFDAARKSVAALIRRLLPGTGEGPGALWRLVHPLLRRVVGSIVLHSQGYYRDGWVLRKAHFLLRNPNGSNRLRLSGSLPSVRRQPPNLTIKPRVSGRVLAPAAISPGTIAASWELPDDVRHSNVVEVTLLSNWSIPHPMKGSRDTPRRVSFRLDRLEIV